MWSVRERSIFQTRYAVQRPVTRSVPASRRYRFLTSGGLAGIALGAGARWSFRGRDAGSARSWKLRARLRTRPRGEQRVPAAQPLFRRALPLNQDVERRLVGAALLDQLDREVQVDVVPGRQRHSVARVESGPDELFGAPVLDALHLRLGDELYLCRSHVPGIRCRAASGSPPVGGSQRSLRASRSASALGSAPSSRSVTPPCVQRRTLPVIFTVRSRKLPSSLK